MALKINCYLCDAELEEPGALILSPPYNEDETTMYVGKIDKYHLCKRCWHKIYHHFMTSLKDWLKHD